MCRSCFQTRAFSSGVRSGGACVSRVILPDVSFQTRMHRDGPTSRSSSSDPVNLGSESAWGSLSMRAADVRPGNLVRGGTRGFFNIVGFLRRCGVQRWRHLGDERAAYMPNRRGQNLGKHESRYAGRRRTRAFSALPTFFTTRGLRSEAIAGNAAGRPRCRQQVALISPCTKVYILFWGRLGHGRIGSFSTAYKKRGSALSMWPASI